MKKFILLFVCLTIYIIGCGTEEPSTDTGQTSDANYYPMSVGDRWEYLETDASGATVNLVYEITGTKTVDFGYTVGEQEVFVMENDFSQNDELRIQYINIDGGRSVRYGHQIYNNAGELKKEAIYDPGFLRFDNSKVTLGETWNEEITRYTDYQTGADTETKVINYGYEIIGINERVTVPAGTFDCIVISRTVVSGGNTEIKQYYWADGVGKVKEITEGDKQEELVSSNLVD